MDRLLLDGLKARSSGNISLKNISVGGWTAENGLAALQSGGYDGRDYSALSGYDLSLIHI